MKSHQALRAVSSEGAMAVCHLSPGLNSQSLRSFNGGFTGRCHCESTRLRRSLRWRADGKLPVGIGLVLSLRAQKTWTPPKRRSLKGTKLGSKQQVAEKVQNGNQARS